MGNSIGFNKVSIVYEQMKVNVVVPADFVSAASRSRSIDYVRDMISDRPGSHS